MVHKMRFFFIQKSNCSRGNKFSFYKQMKYIFISLKMQWKEKPFHNTNLDLNKIISASHLYSAGTVLGWSFTLLFLLSSPLYSCCKRKSDFFRFFPAFLRYMPKIIIWFQKVRAKALGNMREKTFFFYEIYIYIKKAWRKNISCMVWYRT